MVGRRAGGGTCQVETPVTPVAGAPGALRVIGGRRPMAVLTHRLSADGERAEPLRRRRVTFAELRWLRPSRF
jgi:hypothetical protein